MNRLCWWVVDRLSRLLEPDERDAVRGDFTELGTAGGSALRDLLGLVARRQVVSFGTDWRPWLGLAGVVPLGMLLSLMSRQLAKGSAVYVWLYVDNWTWGYLESPGARLDLAQFSAGFLLDAFTLMCWSWTIGFVLGSLSRRTMAINGGLFLLVVIGELLAAPETPDHFNSVVFSLTFYRVMFPLLLRTALVLLPSVWGMYKGFLLGSLPLFETILWAAAIATVTTLATGNLGAADGVLTAIQNHGPVTAQGTGSLVNAGIWGWWRLRAGWQLRLLPLALVWPAAYMVITASARQWQRRMARG